ncbi:hypothetical protein ACF0H5_018461 [Mactra antiquata]
MGKPCPDDNSTTDVPRFTKSLLCIALESRMCPIDFEAQDQRSRSLELHMGKPCLDDNSTTAEPRFTKSLLWIAFGSRMRPIDFEALGSKVKVTGTSYGKTLSGQ